MQPERSAREGHDRLCRRIRERARRFDYPVASEEQVRATEERLGFPLHPLHPLLRKVYREVANGGHVFGPKLPLFGAIGGYQDEWDEGDISLRASRSGWRLRRQVADGLCRHPGAFVECEDLPDRFVPIMDEGCGMIAAIDGWTGQVYRTSCGQTVEEYRREHGQAAREGDADRWMVMIEFLAPTLENWLGRVVEGTHYARVFKQRELSAEMLQATRDGGETGEARDGSPPSE